MPVSALHQPAQDQRRSWLALRPGLAMLVPARQKSPQALPLHRACSCPRGQASTALAVQQNRGDDIDDRRPC